ncbi:energy transducer TonB [Luteimonas notoginsengisoli]|uniref:Energy transducer TonB n=1 Tax=Luteimonas notoginsengisoli TaxID=1578200 RepID=A0ABV7URP7_9GAMM
MKNPTPRICACLLSLLALVAVPAFADEPDAVLEQPGIGAGPALVVESNDGGRYWRLEDAGEQRAPAYPRSLVKAGIEGCVTVGYVIKPDGFPDAYRILRSRASLPSRNVARQMAAALVQMIAQRRYVPGPENPGRLPGFAAEYAVFGVGAGAQCRIDDLGAFMRAGAEGQS